MKIAKYLVIRGLLFKNAFNEQNQSNVFSYQLYDELKKNISYEMSKMKETLAQKKCT